MSDVTTQTQETAQSQAAPGATPAATTESAAPEKPEATPADASLLKELMKLKEKHKAQIEKSVKTEEELKAAKEAASGAEADRAKASDYEGIADRLATEHAADTATFKAIFEAEKARLDPAEHAAVEAIPGSLREKLVYLRENIHRFCAKQADGQSVNPLPNLPKNRPAGHGDDAKLAALQKDVRDGKTGAATALVEYQLKRT